MLPKLLRKRGYGLDTSGEVIEKQQENIEDSSEPWTQHATPPNPVNLAVDTEAKKDFPGLGERKTRYPARSRY